MKRLFYLLTAQFAILIIGTFLQRKGFIEIQQFYAYAIAPVGGISALVLRKIYALSQGRT